MKTRFNIAMDDKGYVELSDDGFDINGWIELELVRTPTDEPEERMKVEIHVTELADAISPYMGRYYRDKDDA